MLTIITAWRTALTILALDGRWNTPERIGALNILAQMIRFRFDWLVLQYAPYIGQFVCFIVGCIHTAGGGVAVPRRGARCLQQAVAWLH